MLITFNHHETDHVLHGLDLSDDVEGKPPAPYLFDKYAESLVKFS